MQYAMKIWSDIVACIIVIFYPYVIRGRKWVKLCEICGAAVPLILPSDDELLFLVCVTDYMWLIITDLNLAVWIHCLLHRGCLG